MIDQNKARNKWNYALQIGKIKRLPCEVCGSEIKIEGHHDDYAKPLKVRWLCKKHHTEWHKENGFQKGMTGDTMVRVDFETRRRFKIKAAKKGQTLKIYLDRLSKSL